LSLVGGTTVVCVLFGWLIKLRRNYVVLKYYLSR